MRYFIVSGIIRRGWFTRGREFHMALMCKRYPSLEDINKEVHRNGVVISNIIELNEADYNSFIEVQQ
jgi:hypothetical protein